MPFKNHQLEYKKEHVINIQHRFCGIVFIPNSKDVLVFRLFFSSSSSFFLYLFLFNSMIQKEILELVVYSVHTTLPESLSMFDKVLCFYFILFLGGNLLNTNIHKTDVSSKLKRHLMFGLLKNYFYHKLRETWIEPSLFKHVTPKQMKSRAKMKNTSKETKAVLCLFLYTNVH